MVGLLLAAGATLFFRSQDRERQIGAAISRGEFALKNDDLQGALLPYVSALALESSDRAQSRTHRTRVGQIMNSLPRLTQMWFPGVPANTVDFSPDGEVVAVGCEDGKIRVYRTGDDIPLCTLADDRVDKVFEVRFTNDGNFIVSANAPKDVFVWRWQTKTVESVVPTLSLATSIYLFDDQFRLVVGTKSVEEQPMIIFGDWNDPGSFAAWEHGNVSGYNNVEALDGWVVNGVPMIVSAPVAGSLQYWDLTAEPALGSVSEWGGNGWKRDLSIDFKNERVAVAEGANIRLCALGSDQERNLRAHDGTIYSVSHSPDGRLMVTSSDDKSVRVWDASALTLVCAPIRHASEVISATFASDSRRVVTGSDAGVVRVWDLATVNWTVDFPKGRLSRDRRHLFDQREGDNQLTIRRLDSSDFLMIDCDSELDDVYVFEGEDKTLLISNIEDSTEEDSSMRLGVRAINPDGTEFAVRSPRSYGGGVKVLTVDEDTNRLVYTAVTEDESILGMIDLGSGGIQESVLDRDDGCSEFHPEEERSTKLYHRIRGGFFNPRRADEFICYTSAKIFRGKIGGALRVLKEVKNPNRHRTSFLIKHLGVLPDKRSLIAGLTDWGKTDLWALVLDLNSGEELDRLAHRDGITHSVASSKGRFLATASEDGSVRIWQFDGENYHLRQHIENERDVQRIAVSDDGRWLAAAMSDRLQLWDLDRSTLLGARIHCLSGSEISDVQFIADDSSVLIQRGRNDWVAIVPLFAEERPVEMLLPLVELLSSERHHTRFGFQPLTKKELKILWETLSSEFPSAFSVSDEEKRRWNAKLHSPLEN